MRNKKITVFLFCCVAVFRSVCIDKTAFDSLSIRMILWENCIKLEKDSSYSQLLFNYVDKSMFNDELCLNEDSISMLFRRYSFFEYGKMLLDDNWWDSFNHTDYSKDYLLDYRFNYLFNCNNDSVKHIIADELLFNNNINGIIGIWDCLDISRLNNYYDFVKNTIAEKQIENIICLIIPIHNIKHKSEEEYLKNVINFLSGSCKKFKTVDFFIFLESNDQIPYDQYLSIIQFFIEF